MKKIYSLILGALLINTVTKAQLTLTQSFNEPSLGNIDYRKGFDSTTALPNTAGTAQVWNFTSITSNTSSVSENTYTTVASIASGTAFPTATIGQTDGTNDTYFKSSTNMFEMIGLVSSSLSLNFTNSAIIANWPISYGYTNTDPIAGNMVTSFGGGTFSGNIVTNATGSGTLQLPGSVTLSNCLQVKSVMNILASITVSMFPVTATITITNYQYYSGTEKFPVLSITSTDISSLVLNNSSTSISVNNNVFSGINEYNNDNMFTVYPNPAHDKVTLKFNSNTKAKVEIFNQLGQSVVVHQLSNETNTIDLSHLNQGVYFIKTTIGNKSSIKKLIKN